MKEALYSGLPFSYTEQELADWKAQVLHEYGHIRIAISLHWRAGNTMQLESLQILTGSGEECGFGPNICPASFRQDIPIGLWEALG